MVGNISNIPNIAGFISEQDNITSAFSILANKPVASPTILAFRDGKEESCLAKLNTLKSDITKMQAENKKIQQELNGIKEKLKDDLSRNDAIYWMQQAGAKTTKIIENINKVIKSIIDLVQECPHHTSELQSIKGELQREKDALIKSNAVMLQARITLENKPWKDLKNGALNTLNNIMDGVGNIAGLLVKGLGAAGKARELILGE